MDLLLDVLLWGTLIGIIHFIIVGILYGNPIIGNIYKDAQKEPGVKEWKNQKEYLIKQFLGTQIEVYILSFAYIYLRTLFTSQDSFVVALILATIFSCIRVYPRFWNMWIQSTYPNKLLLIELVIGTISTFAIIIGLKYFPF